MSGKDDDKKNTEEQNGGTVEEGALAGVEFTEPQSEGKVLHSMEHLGGMYRSWFLDYASYVILDRAVPNMEDGLKPVQRRILHGMFELEDGRYNKAANIIGHTMCYHPHGDAAIGEALVKIAQKDLLIDTQGNWGNTLTGDDAAASRYIEARLSKFALDVLFNKDLTNWQLSYDGRRKEPLALPVKFPLLLAHGTEGIAVGLATKILPHNFCELIKACISSLRERKFELFPDFPSGAMADVSGYRDGERGGKIKVRAVIEVIDSRTLKIKELPFGVTTAALIESILAANDKGKIKIKSVEDNTARDVEILIHLTTSGVSPEMTIEALYAFTDCEVSISANCCVILDNRPVFCTVSRLLEYSASQTREILRRELELRRSALREKLNDSLLEQIFIEERIYHKIEKSKSWEDALATIAAALAPFRKRMLRNLTTKDCEKLTEIRIKRITRFDSERADEQMTKIRADLKEVEANLAEITEYAINFYKDLLKKYGAGRERRTRLETFGAVQAVKVALSNQKLYVNRKEGFIGTSLKKDEYVTDCSDLDEIIVFCKDGKFMVTKVAPKTFVGKNIIHVSVFNRADERCIYHVIYQDGGKSGACYAKRFNVTAVTRDREYDMMREDQGGKLLYFSVNPDGEGEKVEVQLKEKGRGLFPFVFDFSTVEVKARNVVGHLVTKDTVKDVVLKTRGRSTLAAEKIWFDKGASGLNTAEQGEYLGEFRGDDKLLVVYRSGAAELVTYNRGLHLSDDVLKVRKFMKGQVMSVVYFEGEREMFFAKRFAVDEDTFGRRQEFITPHEKSRIIVATLQKNPLVKVSFQKIKKATPPSEVVKIVECVDVRSVKALGSKLSPQPIKAVEVID